MGSRNHDRELRQARAAYIGAVRQLNAAMRDFDDSGMPLDPGPGPEPYPWTARHVQIVNAVIGAFSQLRDRRREWDGLRRDWVSPH
jgi:hypothetical protein